MNFVLLKNSSIFLAVIGALSPFMAFAIIMLLTRKRHQLSAMISIAAISVSFISAVILLWGRWQAPSEICGMLNWAVSGSFAIPIGVLLDPTSLLMLLIVTVICLLVQIYSIGYMAKDPGFGRYYGYMSLFAGSMISLTIAPNLLQLYIFWELVGLASYLLIGFWYEKFSASTAGKKAFVMTRTGDVAFFLGLLLVLSHLGNLNILAINQLKPNGAISSGLLTLAVLLIFGGIIGKSAQFPLLTWLPDAMEGPTPVSALLHSATMVAAGVYLFGRLFPFFSLSSTAMGICLTIGTLSMLLASTMAMVSHDIKQVWAFSTISQLGYMIMGMASGNFFAGFFHLTTHAGFKALLFLCSGVFIHHFETNDIKTIGQKGGRNLRLVMVCMTLAAAALSGLPPLSGFFSKEAILGALAQLDNPIWLIAGLLGVLLTSYYAFRLTFLILLPEKIDQNHPNHVKGDRDDRFMAIALWVLAVITLLLGFCKKALSNFLLQGKLAMVEAHTNTQHEFLGYIALGLALGGVLLAFLEYGRKGAKRVGFVENFPRIFQLFSQRWYLDHFYRHLLDRVIYGGLSRAFNQNDRLIIDGGIDGIADGTISLSQILTRLQTGFFQLRFMVIFAVMVLIGLYVLT
jgi:NADH-quinone oxidoreductase subunit L